MTDEPKNPPGDASERAADDEPVPDGSGATGASLLPKYDLGVDVGKLTGWDKLFAQNAALNAAQANIGKVSGWEKIANNAKVTGWDKIAGNLNLSGWDKLYAQNEVLSKTLKDLNPGFKVPELDLKNFTMPDVMGDQAYESLKKSLRAKDALEVGPVVQQDWDADFEPIEPPEIAYLERNNELLAEMIAHVKSDSRKSDERDTASGKQFKVNTWMAACALGLSICAIVATFIAAG